jgi:hypothetical protein
MAVVSIKGSSHGHEARLIIGDHPHAEGLTFDITHEDGEQFHVICSNLTRQEAWDIRDRLSDVLDRWS